MIQEKNTKKVKRNILLTGSSGLVAQKLLPLLNQHYNVYTIDRIPNKSTDIVSCITNENILNKIPRDKDFIIVHLAAARFDYGISPKFYYQENVNNTVLFLNNLKKLKISHFILYSSVAIIPGEYINFKENLSCDDAYRFTKYQQFREVQDFCSSYKIQFTNLMPSAIHTSQKRTDTNIAKLQKISVFLPFIPKINVVKSVTSLQHLSNFTLHLIDEGKIGSFLVIDYPSLTVSDIIQRFTKKKLLIIPFPFLHNILKFVAFLSTKILGFSFFTPNRVTKLFSDTSYENYKIKYNYDYYLKFLNNSE